MGLNEQDRNVVLPGFIDFHTMNPDARPLTIDMAEDLIRYLHKGDKQSLLEYHHYLPERAGLAEFDASRPYGIYRQFAEEYGNGLVTNIFKKGLQEGDIFTLHMYAPPKKGEKTKRTVKKRVHLLILNRSVAQGFATRNKDICKGICSSANGRMALVIVTQHNN